VIEKYFSEKDHQTIAEAVRSAEKRASGQIVPYVVGASHDYPEAVWRGATIGTIAAILVYAALVGTSRLWGVDPLRLIMATLTGAVVGSALVFSCPWIRRKTIGKRRMSRMVHERAAQAFLKEELFGTRYRNGILLFVSLFERRVVILADKGIHAKVDEADWSSITGEIAAGIGQKRAGTAVASGISRCADILLEHGFTREVSDTNELPDDLRTEER
jgi:putative membrane protein